MPHLCSGSIPENPTATDIDNFCGPALSGSLDGAAGDPGSPQSTATAQNKTMRFRRGRIALEFTTPPSGADICEVEVKGEGPER